MKHIFSIKKNLYSLLLSCVMAASTLLLTACGGPSAEKIAQAQDTYSNLVAIHNRVVSAHRQIEDDSLDEKLVALGEKITQVNTYNLNDMSDEEIDMLIDTMDSIIDTYEEYLTAINDIRDTENAAILTPINISLINDTNLTFVGLSLHQKGTIQNADLLETLSGFMPAQRMAGLVIYRDVQNTPWVLELVSEDGSLYELNLSVKD